MTNDGINLPFLGISGTADTTAPIIETEIGVFTIRKELVRPISARDMNRKERKVYESS